LLRNHEGDESIAELRSEYPQIYKWNKSFAVVVNVDSTLVVARPPDIIGQEAIDINFVKRITYFEHAFSDIRRAHGEDHAKGRTLYGCVCEQIDNIGRIFCKCSRTCALSAYSVNCVIDQSLGCNPSSLLVLEREVKLT